MHRCNTDIGQSIEQLRTKMADHHRDMAEHRLKVELKLLTNSVYDKQLDQAVKIFECMVNHISLYSNRPNSIARIPARRRVWIHSLGRGTE
jgi:predicted class III extradiol MEMO1 family dioxygenase